MSISGIYHSPCVIAISDIYQLSAPPALPPTKKATARLAAGAAPGPALAGPRLRGHVLGRGGNVGLKLVPEKSHLVIAK